MNVGTSVAHYQILSIIGRGGMGEVYKALDTKLRREVALKALSPDFVTDADRVARLEREATLLAALNHPNIAAIHGIEEHEGRKFLVLELVEGGTLADRLLRGPFRIEQALETAAEIASALESAHQRGVVHRDLKPDNVAFTRDGRVKVLDFGIAKSFTVGSSRATTAAVTELGAAIGTAPYMSPEQARGEATDRQTDIWALGVTLYEMLTGRSPFKRDSSTETLACVLETPPDYTRLPQQTPASMHRLIRRCLEKDRKRRFHDMADVRIEIEDALAGLGASFADGQSQRAARFRTVAAGAVVVAAFLGLAALGFRWLGAPELPPASVARLSITGLERAFDYPYGMQGVAVSPDGAQLAFTTGNGSIGVRRLSQPQIERLQTPNVDQGTNPFFSPDGTWIGAGTLLRLPSAGGAATRIYDHAERPAGATWGPDGTIVFATSSGLYRVAAEGGAPELLAKPNAERGELLYAWPHWLPNGRRILFTVVPARASIDAAQIAILDLETGETRVILTGGTSPRYAPTGHLVYAARQRLLAVAFDADSGTTSGQPVELRGIAVSTHDDNGAAQFAFSENGTLVFLEPDTQAQPLRFTLSWVDRDGNETALPLEPNRYNAPRVSPDGGRIAFDIPGANRDVWIWDVARESLTRLTDGPTEDLLPMWAPDGRRVYFASDRNGNMDIYSQVADGSSEARSEVAQPGFQAPSSVSADGTTLISTLDFRHLAVVDLAQSTFEPLLQSDAVEWLGELSPDGRWIAYDSNESGQFEVYLRPFPDVSSARVQVSAGGGGFARWGPTGSNELYYVAPDGAIMAASVEADPTLQVSRPSRLFQLPEQVALGTGPRTYDIATDGRFLVRRPVADDASQFVTLTVILNWFEELRAQVPIPR